MAKHHELIRVALLLSLAFLPRRLFPSVTHPAHDLGALMRGEVGALCELEALLRRKD